MLDSKRAFILFSLIAAAATPLPAEEPAGAEQTVIPSLAIDSEGNVGVGTEAPLGPFNVTTGARGVDPDEAAGVRSCPNSTDWYDENHNGQADAGECKVTWLIVTAAGNVGLGTALPAARLHVLGSVRAEEGRFELNLLALWEATSAAGTACKVGCGRGGVCLAAFVGSVNYSCEDAVDEAQKTCLCAGPRF
jgi:hypothetical protein